MLSKEDVELLKTLEAGIMRYMNLEDGDCDAPSIEDWKPFPFCYDGYGPGQDGCYRDPGIFSLHDEVMSNVLDKFYTYYGVVRDEAQKKVGLADDYENRIELYVEPSYEDRSTILIIQESTKRLLLKDSCKAWNFCFNTPQELVDQFRQDIETVASKIKEVAIAK